MCLEAKRKRNRGWYLGRLKRLLKELIILIICIYLLIDIRNLVAHNNGLLVVAICVTIGTSLNNILEIIKGGE